MRKIVIFATKFNARVVKDQLEELRDKYAIIIQTPNVPEFLKFTGDYNHVTVRDDSSLLDQDILNVLETIPQAKRSWYRQQFIKFKSIEYEDDEYLILDGDTFLFNKTIKDIFDTKCKLRVNEKYLVYNALIALIFPKVDLQNYSSVANCILVKPNLVKKSIGDINTFFRNIIYTLNGDFSGLILDLSEYQVINTLQIDSSPIQQFHLFRRADLLTERLLLDSNKFQTKKYHGYCIEKNHNKKLKKKILAHIIYIFGYKYW